MHLTAANSRIHARPAAFTLAECIFAMAISAVLFGALYSLSGQCLRLLSDGRQLIAMEQAAENRMEALRSVSWKTLTDPDAVAAVALNSAAGNEDRYAGCVETVTLDAYTAPLGTPVVISRSAGAATVDSRNAALADEDIVTANIELRWTASLGGRERAVVRSGVIARNSH